MTLVAAPLEGLSVVVINYTIIPIMGNINEDTSAVLNFDSL